MLDFSYSGQRQGIQFGPGPEPTPRYGAGRHAGAGPDAGRVYIHLEPGGGGYRNHIQHSLRPLAAIRNTVRSFG